MKRLVILPFLVLGLFFNLVNGQTTVITKESVAIATAACKCLTDCMTKDIALAKACISSMAVNASSLALPNPACKDQIIDSAVKTRDMMLKYVDGVMTCMNNATVPIIADDKTYRMQACQAITKMFSDQAKTMPSKPNMESSAFKIGNIAIPQCLIDAKLGAGRLAQLAQCCPKFKTCDDANAASRTAAIKNMQIRNVQLYRLHRQCSPKPPTPNPAVTAKSPMPSAPLASGSPPPPPPVSGSPPPSPPATMASSPAPKK